MSGLKTLREKMEQTTPFEMGLTEYQGETWQLMIVLTSDSVAELPKEETSQCSWTGLMVETERWLFLNISLAGKNMSEWSFGFDCNDSGALVFLRQLLRDGRLMIGFRDPSRAVQILNVAGRLVEELGEDLELYLGHWKESKMLGNSGEK